MFTVTINGNTPAELYSNMETMLNNRPGVPVQQNQPDPFSAPSNVNPTQPVVPAATQQPPIASPDAQAAVSVPTAPVQENTTPAPAPTAPATHQTPGVPVAAAPTYTLEQLAKAGASLVQAGKMEQALALLARYGVQTVNQLKPEQYGAFATELRAIGAQL